ncbi:MAG: DUF5685 family protein [Clostridia bacterium]
MFGYIKINKPELKVKEYEVYRGIYCSLCKALHKHFGIFSRMILSYDLTFLALLRISINGQLLNFKGSRCPFNPTKRCNFCTNADEELKFTASVTMMMFYHKVKDNLHDSKFFKKLLMFLLLPFASVKYKKAKRMYPELADSVQQCMKKQAEIEDKNTNSIDEAAHQSAHALGKILSFNQEKNQSEYYRFGYLIGKWVYLADALDDIADDIKDKSFNVFVNKYELTTYDKFDENIKQEIQAQLNMNLGMAIETYKKFDSTAFEPIINNILIDGMHATMRQIMKGNKKT